MTARSRMQRSLLIAFLISIGLSALLAILGVLFDSIRWGEQIIASTVTFSICSIAAMVAAATTERQRWHPLGPLALGAVATAFLAVMLLIWAEKIFGYAFWSSELRPLLPSVLSTCVVAGFLMILCLMSLARLRTGFYWVRTATIVAVLLAATPMMILLGEELLDALDIVKGEFDYDLRVAWGAVAAVALALVLRGILSRKPALDRFRFWLLIVAGDGILVVAMMIPLLGLFPELFGNPHASYSYRSDMFAKSIAVFSILGVSGIVAVWLLHRFSAIRDREAVKTTDLELGLTCPRCRTAQVLPAGRSACAKCKLKFLIEIEEEHCPKCEYPLFGLQTATCPECGAAILSS